MASTEFNKLISYIRDKGFQLNDGQARALEQLFERQLTESSLPKPQIITQQLQSIGIDTGLAQQIVPQFIKPPLERRLTSVDMRSLISTLPDPHMLKEKLATAEWDKLIQALFDGLRDGLVEIVRQPNSDNKVAVTFLESELRQQLRSVSKIFMVKDLDQKFDLRGFAQAIYEAISRSGQSIDLKKA